MKQCNIDEAMIRWMFGSILALLGSLFIVIVVNWISNEISYSQRSGVLETRGVEDACADIVIEGSDQHRGWLLFLFYFNLVLHYNDN